MLQAGHVHESSRGGQLQGISICLRPCSRFPECASLSIGSVLHILECFNLQPVPVCMETQVSPKFLCCIWKEVLSWASTKTEMSRDMLVGSSPLPLRSLVWHIPWRLPALGGSFLVPTLSPSLPRAGLHR